MFLTDALLAVLYPQSCRICGGSVERHRYGVACEACWATHIDPDDDPRAIGFYEGALRESVLWLKRQPYVPQHVESSVTEVVRREPLSCSTRVIPVPLHPKRLRTRGFNQASIIGQAAAKALELPLDEVSLVRVSTTEKYRAGMDAKGRRDTVAGAFRVTHPRLVAGESILLVDDVFTTGATVSACAEVLVAAGAGNIFVLTVARAR